MQLALGHRAVGVRGADAWTAPADFPLATKFGELRVDLRRTSAGPAISRLAFPGLAEIAVPLALSFPQQGSLLFETNESADATLVNTLNTIIVRLLSDTPPGKVSFTIIDPVGLGKNFAGLMHLGDYEESLINRRIWTQRDHIEERLGELSEHIEKVIQMYLRNEYATITEYNAQAGSVAEKYHFLVIADFPTNFSELAARRLQSIAISGPRCGVYTLVHWDQRVPLPEGISPEELRKASVSLRRQGNEFVMRSRNESHISFTLERNIVYSGGAPIFASEWNGTTNYRLDRNLYWDSTGREKVFPGDRTLEAWQKETGQDLHSRVADPLFANPEAGDFTLKSGSPAVEIGFQPIDLAKAGRQTARRAQKRAVAPGFRAE